eukprot:2481150-Pleurochrysis_carterae.AAC.1
MQCVTSQVDDWRVRQSCAGLGGGDRGQGRAGGDHVHRDLGQGWLQRAGHWPRSLAKARSPAKTLSPAKTWSPVES